MARAQRTFLLVALALLLAGCESGSSPSAASSSMASVPPDSSTTSKASGATIVVTSSADTGRGTLRQALLEARSGDTITFDPTVFPPTAPTIIQLSGEQLSSVSDTPIALPNLTQGNLTIDASNAGVILDGSAIETDWVNGLAITSSGNVIWGLQVVNFTGNGILIFEGSDNVIGGDPSIGTGPSGQGNLASRNMVGIGLWGSGSSNIVVGNMIGTDPTGTLDWGNQLVGVLVADGTTHNVIGPGNTIFSSGSIGVLVDGIGAVGNTITRNSMHDNAWGIRLSNGSNNMLGYPLISGLDLEAGTISGSSCAGCLVEVFSASGVEGDAFEGQTRANASGRFAFDLGAAFTGPYVTATATDTDGNTSEFPPFVAGYDLMQKGNINPTVELQPKPSNELDDNRIGTRVNDLWELNPETFPGGTLDVRHILDLGVTRASVAFDDLDFDQAHWDKPETPIDPSHDAFVTSLTDSGIAVTYVLQFWDKEFVAQGGELPYPRFKTEGEIQRYLDFVRYMVHSLKDRVEYFEIWNEPNSHFLPGAPLVELPEYLELVTRAIPVIREEFPEAKIVVGGIGDIAFPDAYEYFMGVIGSDEIMPLVDVVSWHTMYGASPEYDFFAQYYYDYPAIVADIKSIARSHGFRGEFVADELSWLTWGTPCHCRAEDLEALYSETEAAKYYARGILINLGLDVSVSQFYVVTLAHPQLIIQTIRNLTTTLAGSEPIDLTVNVESEAADIVSIGFTTSNGDLLLALWRDGTAADVDLGTAATVTVAGVSADKATVVDVVYGLEVELTTDQSEAGLVIRDLLVRDSPLVLRFSGASLP